MSIPDSVKKFGTAPVFFTAISTILGAIMFLRFGFAVGNVGFGGTILIILLGNMVTIPTAMAIAEIATNRKVEGGGEYFIISRSFGLVIGPSIGIALYLSQAISVAFYIIAFAESFAALFNYLINAYPEMPSSIKWLLQQKQTISIPALIGLTAIVLIKGADLGVKALYVVVALLFLSLIAFFTGDTGYSDTHNFELFGGLNNMGFFAVFAIIFPAFTGMTAGVGLSGDLKNPGKSIPTGTLTATFAGMIIYIFIAYKLTISASPEDLANTDHLVMANIAVQGSWLIPLGLAAATISSALGSLMVAPRTLQAIARDKVIPSRGINFWLSKGKGKTDEPYNATIFTIVIAFFFVLMGALDSVAGIISMFFMVTYGTLCLISFLSHFAADPSYRPTFKSRWYLSLFGAVACFILMFMMNAGYALLAIAFMVGTYYLIKTYNKDKASMALIFQGVIFQLSRQLHIFLQKAQKEKSISWRPSIICISESSFERLSSFYLLRWISQKYGFGTYIHKINGYLSKSTFQQSRECKERLIKMAEDSKSNIYIDTLVSPSYTSAIAQTIQLPGISGTDNNLMLLEYSKTDPTDLDNIVENFSLIKSTEFDIAVLGSSERGFGLKKQIHVWITPNDYENANLMILMAYIMLGHKDWSQAIIKIFAIYEKAKLEEERENLYKLIEEGKLPISINNIELITRGEVSDVKAIINDKSSDADFTILGFRSASVKHSGVTVFEGFDKIGNTLFINATQKNII